MAVSGNAITGTLKYVTGYTGFSGDEELQSGNYLALKFAPVPEGTTVNVRLENGASQGVDLDSDMNIVIRIADITTQKSVIATCTKEGFDSETFVYDISGLTLEEAE